MGYPGVFQGNPCLYPSKPVPMYSIWVWVLAGMGCRFGITCGFGITHEFRITHGFEITCGFDMTHGFGMTYGFGKVDDFHY
jgi:hypothetical protein